MNGKEASGLKSNEVHSRRWRPRSFVVRIIISYVFVDGTIGTVRTLSPSRTYCSTVLLVQGIVAMV